MSYRLLFVLLFATALTLRPADSLAQRVRIDQLLEQYSENLPDTAKADLLATIGFNYYSLAPDSGLMYAKQALTLAEQIELPALKARAYDALTANYWALGQYGKALDAGKKGLEINRQIGNADDMARTLNNVSAIYHTMGQYDKALQGYQQSLPVFQQEGNERLLGEAYSNIGLIYQDKGDYDLALQNHLRSVEIRNRIDDREGLASSYFNIAGIYKQQSQFDLAIDMIEEALQIERELGNKLWIANCLQTIGGIQTEQGRNIEALKSLREALGIQTQIGDRQGRAHSLRDIGNLLLRGQEYDSATYYFDQALNLSRQIDDRKNIGLSLYGLARVDLAQKRLPEAFDRAKTGLEIGEAIGNMEMVREGAQLAHQAASELGRFPEAYRYLKRHQAARDSLYGLESTRKVARMQARYEHQAEQERIALEHEAAILQTRLQLVSALGALIFAVFVAFLLIRSNRIRQSANRKLQDKNRTIQSQNESLTQQAEELQQLAEELSSQNDYIAYQKNQLSKAFDDISQQNEHITNSIAYASRIQHAILPSERRMRKAFLDHFVFYSPKDVVSGDFYWLSEKGDRTFFAAADCTGHGVPGAFMSMIGSALLSYLVNERHLSDPAEALRQLHDQVRKDLGQEEELNNDGMEIGLLSIDKQKRRLEFAGAKLSLYLVQDGQILAVKANRKPIGGYQREEARTFDRQTVELDRPTVAYLFSDGYQDQFTLQKGKDDPKKFSRARLLQLLQDIHHKPFDEQRQIVAQTMESWQGDAPRQDDMLVIGLKLNSARPNPAQML